MTFEKSGYLVGLVGPRFEIHDKMESQFILSSHEFTTKDLGYGPRADPNSQQTQLLRLWAKFYHQYHDKSWKKKPISQNLYDPTQTNRQDQVPYYFPTFEEVFGDGGGGSGPASMPATPATPGMMPATPAIPTGGTPLTFSPVQTSPSANSPVDTPSGIRSPGPLVISSEGPSPRQFVSTKDLLKFEFTKVTPALYLNEKSYKRRIKISAETFLFYAQDLAEKNKKMVYCHVIGLGLGSWQVKRDEQNTWTIEVFEEILNAHPFNGICDLDFSWFHDNVQSCGGASDNENIKGEFPFHPSLTTMSPRTVEPCGDLLLKKAFFCSPCSLDSETLEGGAFTETDILFLGHNSHIKIHFSKRNTAEPLGNPGKLLVAMYAW